MRGKYNQGTAFWFPIVFDNEGYLYFSAGERGAEFVNPQDITRDNGKIYRLHADGRIPADNPFVGKTGAKESHLFLRAPQSTRISQAPNYRSYLGSRARTERRRSTS
jgi:glucose/arabinose dehydrogenase